MLTNEVLNDFRTKKTSPERKNVPVNQTLPPSFLSSIHAISPQSPFLFTRGTPNSFPLAFTQHLYLISETTPSGTGAITPDLAPPLSSPFLSRDYSLWLEFSWCYFKLMNFKSSIINNPRCQSLQMAPLIWKKKGKYPKRITSWTMFCTSVTFFFFFDHYIIWLNIADFRFVMRIFYTSVTVLCCLAGND